MHKRSGWSVIAAWGQSADSYRWPVALAYACVFASLTPPPRHPPNLRKHPPPTHVASLSLSRPHPPSRILYPALGLLLQILLLLPLPISPRSAAPRGPTPTPTPRAPTSLKPSHCKSLKRSQIRRPEKSSRPCSRAD